MTHDAQIWGKIGISAITVIECVLEFNDDDDVVVVVVDLLEFYTFEQAQKLLMISCHVFRSMISKIAILLWKYYNWNI